MLSILLVDDHSIVRTGLKVLIGTHLPDSRIDEAFDGASAMESIKGHQYDLIMMDVSMPNTDSFAIVSEILAFDSSLRIIMFSMNCEEIYAKRFLKIGAMGYLNKEAPSAEIKRAIDMVINNRRYISAEMSEKLLLDFQSNRHSENPFELLSQREFEIVQYLIQGASSAEISKNLSLHSSTIATYKSRIFEKLKCTNLIELSNLAKTYNVTVQV